MSRPKVLLGTTMAVVLTSSIIGGAPAAARAADADLAPLAGPAAMAAPADLGQVGAELLDGLAPSTHGGVHIDSADRSITLMVTAGASATAVGARAARINRPGVTVKVKKVDRSREVLEHLRDDGVWNNLPADLAGQVTKTQIDTLDNRVVVEVANPTREVRRSLKKRFGDAVSVRAGSARTAMTRYDDFSPYFGADRILMRFPNGQHYGACTAGFGATYAGTQVMVTAGHCAPYGNMATPTSVTNGRMNGENGCTAVGGCSTAPIGSFGNVWQTRMRTHDTQAQANAGPLSVDLALIATLTVPTIWRADSDNLTSPVLSFPGAATLPSQSGAVICHSGATSSGDCGFSLQAEIATVTIDLDPGAPGRWARFQNWDAVSTNRQVCGGDSGGPVYTQLGSGVSMMGVVSTGWGPVAGTVKGQPCNRNLGFVFWGQGRAVFPNYTPRIQ
ncbi:hypothetical protein [Asanoa ishikariensis]|uniref:hypothetical protein n=1 Tax=Asanoa ishikariensis TaxID=137265 RepID=UPI00115FFF8E|nr:hypothetical protein [Asanoa ishikariensis]